MNRVSIATSFANVLQSPRLSGVAAFVLCAAMGCGNGDQHDAADFKAPPAAEEEVVRLEVVDLDETEVAETASNSEPSNSGVRLVSAEIPEQSEETDESTNWAEGTPEWLLLEITKLQASTQSDSGTPLALTPAARRSQLQVIELATEVIAKTHSDPSREQLFNNAVDYLADARMKLAVAGDAQQGEFLSQEADALFARDSTSFAAVEAASSLVELTQIQAEDSFGDDPQWALGFAHQTRLFAEKFPQESSRAGVNLIAAARLCEKAGQHSEALECLAVVQDRFPESPFADQIAEFQRRLQLPGQPLVEFGGSTFDGGFTSINEYRGKALLIVFWASDSKQFRTELPIIQQTLDRYQGEVQVVGVNLDKEAHHVDQFLRSNRNDWKHVFFSDSSKRGLNNPVAQYYAVTEIPTYWLVDASGVVRSINVTPATLDQMITEATSK